MRPGRPKSRNLLLNDIWGLGTIYKDEDAPHLSFIVTSHFVDELSQVAHLLGSLSLLGFDRFW